jgi:hypothetical protein
MILFLGVQVVVGHSGLPLSLHGPFLGVSHDFKIWCDSGVTEMMGEDETILGDRAYASPRRPRAEMIAAIKRGPGGALTQAQSDFNELHGYVACSACTDVTGGLHVVGSGRVLNTSSGI